MITDVGHPDASRIVDDHALRAIELARLIAVRAPLEHEFAVSGEFLNPVAVAILSDVVTAGRVLHDVGHESELPRLVPLRAAEDVQQFAFRRIKQDAEIMRVGDDQIPLAIEVHSGGAAGRMCRRCPDAQKFPSASNT